MGKEIREVGSFMFDVSDFLRSYARDYTDVDELYRIASGLDLVSNRIEFESAIMEGLRDPSIVSHIYIELPFKRHWTKIETLGGKSVGLIKWTDNPRFVGR